MDSSPDLSLKLRRGSNDSRDSYYMDFAQGIDSDIEEVSTVVTSPANVIAMSSDSSDMQALMVVPVPTTDLDSVEKDKSKLATKESQTPAPPTPPSELEMETISSIQSIPTRNLTSTTMHNLTDSSTTDEEDMSQITPLPMPILPSLKTDKLQMLPSKIPLVDDDEG